MPDLNGTANVNVSSLGSGVLVGVGGCSQCQLQLYVPLEDWRMTVVVLIMATYMYVARIVPKYWGMENTCSSRP